MMRRLYVVGLLVWIACSVWAQGARLRSKTMEIGVDEKGYFSSIKVNNQELLDAKSYPLVTVGTDGRLAFPVKMQTEPGLLRLTLSDGGAMSLGYTEHDTYVTLEVKSISKSYDMLVYGPIGLNINKVVGDIVGVVQGDQVAFGAQALNNKTNGGLPQAYAEAIKQHFGYQGKPAELSVEQVADYRLTATDTGDGTVLQLSVCRRDEDRYQPVFQLKKSLAAALEGEDALIEGARIALFGCARSEALAHIGQIEQEQGLPHPLIEGEWGKTTRAAMRSYLITDFTEKNLAMVLEKAKRAGFPVVYHSGPFADWGHFTWNASFSSDGDAGVKRMVEQAADQGIGIGVHTLSNFITTKDPYVAPVLSKHLLKQGVLRLKQPLTADQTDLLIEPSDLFEVPLSLNGLQIDDELIQYTKVEPTAEGIWLRGCKRGAFQTKAVAHPVDHPLYKLSDHAYKVFFPDMILQDSLADRIAELMNYTGIRRISFDGLEGCAYTGHGDYAMARFVERIYKKWDHEVVNDASRLTHNLWHVHSYVNWGEPWGEEMRTGQVSNRIKNQAFYQRNLFPRMLGWFQVRLADRKFECTTLEDLEWALSESAGFDAGYAMSIRCKTLEGHGQIDQLLETIRRWDRLREAQAFSEEQKARLKDPETEWHLEAVDAQHYRLYPLTITKRYRCDLSELQPGQPGGADWYIEGQADSPCKIQLHVEGEGSVSNLSFTTPEGVVKFEGEVESGQYLFYDFDGKATLTDRNYRVIQTVPVEGALRLKGTSSAISLSCEAEPDTTPEVVVRFITRGTPEEITLK